MYYDKKSLQRILSYNALLNMLFGERGVGKTYSVTQYCCNRFIKTDKQFAYVRRFATELDEAVPNFMSKVKNDEDFKNHNLSRKGKKFLIDDKVCGYAMTLTQAQNLKGTEFSNVETIIFDEFIIEDTVHHYLKGEVTAFLGLIETLSRMRDFRCFMLANSVTISNPYFIEFDLKLPYCNDIMLFKENTILVQYMKNEEYRQAKKETRFGKLIKGTSYEQYAVDNEFLKDNKNFVSKKSAKATYYFTIYYKSIYFGIWIDYSAGKIWVSEHIDNFCKLVYTLTLEDHQPNTLLLKNINKSPFFKTFIDNYKIGNVYFENIKIKNIFYEVIKNILV